jgi:hypothetical protein
MDLETFNWLLTSDGQALLAEAMTCDLSDAAQLRELTRLRRQATPERAAAAFEIAPETPVIVASDDVPLVISLGAPSAVASRQQWQFVVGLAGAAVAIGSAMALALAINGGLR